MKKYFKFIKLLGTKIKTGDSNWDYYYFKNHVYSIAKDSSCSSSSFGDMNHFFMQKKGIKNGARY